ncbi:MAG: YggS family pyridoxal phosphate-dependent enzyme [Nitrospinae bacterium]|nr:YggS family pyridoxal phosphate-dependent enzyme [Nitrospinota bacterium]MBI3812913.1 YggS family pyridoxal phosphate-dependent enzyme [Nitrospinota bacterium]
MNSISANLIDILQRIKLAAERSGRDAGAIKLIAVTKTVDVRRIKEAIAAGVTIIGESRVREAREKFGEIGRGVEWHLIGHLQTNKVKYIFDIFSLIHSVDSLPLAEEIQKRAEDRGLKTDILVEVNLSGEKTKFGVSPENTIGLVKDILRFKDIRIKGLMTIPPFSESPEDSRKYFRMLRMLRDDIQREGIEMKELSMGMSNDFEAAVEEGATMVRVGNAIFGEREQGDK